MAKPFESNWITWTPQERATLLFVRRNGQVLLIRKKHGLGAGKIKRLT
jgi:8-oxo-dGTP diphosphatase